MRNDAKRHLSKARAMNERELFLSALEIENPESRRAHVQSACAGDAALWARVESLLASHEGQSQFLNTPVVEQLSGEWNGASAATLFAGFGSTRDEMSDAAAGVDRSDSLTRQPGDRDDETRLDFLQPSSRPESLGRLAHFEILEVEGRGAFGIVLKAFDEKLQRIVAIKVLSPQLAASSPAHNRFLREARASAAVRHENVVRIYSVEDQPRPHFVMEYIPGVTLQRRLDEHGPLGLLDVLRLGKQIADGLAAAHAQDLIHRDIKPGNILLEANNNDHVKITDFGLARTADDAGMTQSGMIAGTPLYMSPEQALGYKPDPRADLFSFGSVLYHMLSGQPPFCAPSTLAVLMRVTDDTPQPIQEIVPEAPDWMCELVGRLHAKNPDDRYGSAQAVSQLLATCLADVQQGRVPRIPTTAGPAEERAEQVAHQPRAVRRRPLRVAAWVLVLLFIALGIAEATGISQLASTIVQLAFGSGTQVIEIDDADVKITLDDEPAIASLGEITTRLTQNWVLEEVIRIGPEVDRLLADAEVGEGDVDHLLPLAGAFGRGADWARAGRLLDLFLERHPDNYWEWEYRRRVAALVDDRAAFERISNQIARLAETMPVEQRFAVTGKAFAYFPPDKQRRAQARSFVRRYRDACPDITDFRSLAEVMYMSADAEGAQEQLDRIPEHFGNQHFKIEVALLAGKCAAMRGDQGQAESLLDQASQQIQRICSTGDLGPAQCWNVASLLPRLRDAEIAVHGKAVTPLVTPQRLAELAGMNFP
jgi:hypothetical protein